MYFYVYLFRSLCCQKCLEYEESCWSTARVGLWRSLETVCYCVYGLPRSNVFENINSCRSMGSSVLENINSCQGKKKSIYRGVSREKKVDVDKMSCAITGKM